MCTQVTGVVGGKWDPLIWGLVRDSSQSQKKQSSDSKFATTEGLVVRGLEKSKISVRIAADLPWLL